MTDMEELLREASLRQHQRKMFSYRPYGHPDTLKKDGWSRKPWQLEFHSAPEPERMLMAANRVGKTRAAGAEVSFHATGEYPTWWEGKRFSKPVLIWCGSVTNESSRDVVQKELLGGRGEDRGTGFIPEDRIGRVTQRQAGIGDVVDTVKVRHKTGGESTIVFKSYDQGWEKWQGTAPDVIWLDEEPAQYRIFTEAQTRILTSRGTLMVTFTPLLGETELVLYFVHRQPKGTFVITATWDDAPHLTEEDKSRLRGAYPDYELDARTKGVPTVGEGRVFPVPEEDITVEPFEIPPYYARICGIDFGIDHPAAAAWIAWDRDRDVLYVYDCYRKKGETSVYHASAIRERGDWIPVAWPHDGLKRGPADGTPLRDQYRKHGCRMLSMSARYDNDKGGGQPTEPVILEILERMKTGRFKVFETCTEWFQEFRSYHRKDGKLSALREDILKATFYGVMMRRYARTNTSKAHTPRAGAPLSTHI